MENENRPLVTIISLIYNNARAAIPGLEAISRQLYRPVEHIIFDDCSTDDSVELVENWIRENNYECRFVKHEKNRGICGTLNHGIELARGKYLYGITDDLMMPDKLLDDVALLESHPEYAFCYSKMIIRYVHENREVHAPYRGSDNLFYDYLEGKVTIPTPTTTYRLSVFKEVGLFDPTLLFEDYDMFLRILYKHKAGFIDKYTVVYNIHGQNIQISKEIALFNEFLRILEKWKFLPRYKYYKRSRHLFTFCQLAAKNKREALKHLPHSLPLFWQPRLYKNLFKLVFYWPGKPQKG
jgi:glycosyltransferase involved in cell wall biosynthesis